MDGGDDLIELFLGFGDAGEAKDFERLLQIGLRDQPARTARNDEQHDEKEHGGDAGDTEHPAPVIHAEVPAADEGVGDVGEQDADDDIHLEEADQAAAPVGR